MIRPDLYFFGFSYFIFSADDIPLAATRLLRYGLTGKIDKNGILRVISFKTRKYQKALLGIEYEISETKGAMGFLIKNRKRWGAIAAVAFTLLLFSFTSDFVWDIRIDGNESLPTVTLLDELAGSGLDVGKRWSLISQSKVERAVVEENENIAWLNINRVGTVAYVTVKEKNSSNELTIKSEPCNIVAECDCVIESITVRKGIAVVKPGDTVKAGDLLISGTIPDELGGGFTAADGDVVGRIEYNQTLHVSRNEKVKVYNEEELCGLSVKILGCNINIFKKYGNLDKDCDIIDEKYNLVIFDSVVLPITVNKIYLKSYDYVEKNYNDNELIKIATARFNQQRIVHLADRELISSSTEGCFDHGYTIKSKMVILSNVGATESFSD